MTVFAAAMDAILSDPNFGEAATWKAGGTGPDVACTVVRERPSVDAGAFGTTVRREAQIIHVRSAQVPAPAKGDTVAIGAEVLTVRAVSQDALALIFVCEC